MSKGPAKVVACFEDQTIAIELSAKVVEEGLEAISKLQQEDINMSRADPQAEVCAKKQHSDDELQEESAGFDQEKPEVSRRESAACARETSQESSETITMQNEPDQDQKPASPEEADSQAGRPTPSPPLTVENSSRPPEVELEQASSGDGELENLSQDESVSSVSVSSYDDFCGQQASEINLRQLKMSALEDVLVCGKNRHSTESARRLFHMLTATAPADQDQQRGQQSRAKRSLGNRKLKASSLSSHSSRADDDDEYYEDEDRCNNNNSSASNGSGNCFYEDIYAPQDGAEDNYGTIKIIRRQCCGSANSNWSSAGSSAANNCNYGRTLVCSVSPVSQLARSASTSSSASSSTRANIVDGQQHQQQHNDPDKVQDQDYLGPYGIDGEEIRQCRVAFRENRRLIEQVQAIAVKRNEDQQQGTTTTSTLNRGSSSGPTSAPGLSRSSSQAALQSKLTDRPRWTDSLNRRQQLPNCSHCHKKLYPMDRMELDFTRATLNIHRNCFKCHVCSTLLRLETYASIDTKLYCPAHTKSATLNTTQLAHSSVPPTSTSLTVNG